MRRGAGNPISTSSDKTLSNGHPKCSVGGGTEIQERQAATVNTRSLILASILLAASPLLGQQPAAKSHTSHVKGRGCVRPGKEEGCFVLHDIKQHRVYDLSFDATETKPDHYTAIWFEGIGYSHDAHCSQGRPVHVSHWKPLPGKCSKPRSSQPARD